MGAFVRTALVVLLAACLGVGGYLVGSDRGTDPAAGSPAGAGAGAGTAAGRTAPAGSEPSDARAPRTLPRRTTTSAGRCDGALVHEKVREVTVPDGAHCVLVATRVGSNISVGHDASLELVGSTAGGDVEAEDARSVTVTRSGVSGNLQLEGGGSAYLVGSHVDGDVEWQDQHGHLVVRSSSIGGNLEATENAGDVTIQGTKVDGDLECDGNRPAPVGGDNIVRGDRSGQCHGL